MNMLLASINDIEEVISWIVTEEECRLWAGPAVTFPISKGLLLDQIAFCPGNSFCCKSDVGLLAFGQVLKKDGRRSHLARVISNPAYRGHGFGRKCCNSLVAYAFEHGSSKVSLNVYRENSQAIRLYESLGFREQAEKSDETNIFMLKNQWG